MNMKNILSATLLVAGLFTAQTAAAEVRFFQDAGRADGKVAMSFTIKADGSVSDARITRSSGKCRHRQCRNRMDAAPNHAARFCERRGKRFSNRERNQIRRLMIL